MHSEKDLIEGCKQGKHKAFEALYQKYAGRLLAIAMRYVFTTFEAEDILQDSFIKIIHSISTYDHKGSFEGWLKRIVVTTSINHYHKHTRKQFNTGPWDIEEEEEDGITEDIIDKISADELIQLIQTLPDGYRMVFNMYVIEGYSHKEIAELLHISEGTSKSQLSKARGMLKQKLIQKGIIRV